MTLVQDIYKVLSKDIEFSEDKVQDFGHTLAKLLHSRLIEDKSSKGMRLSRLGSKCDRKRWYEEHSDEAEPLEPWVRLKFLYGDILEALVLWLAKLSGHDVRNEQLDVSVDGVPGHIDAEIDGELYDVKSASPYSFDKFVSGLNEDNDDFGYLEQLNSYMTARGKERGHFLVVDKVSGKLHDAVIPKSVDVSKVIEHQRQVLSAPSAPARGFADIPDGKSGNYKLPTYCSYCAFKGQCWPGLRVFAYSTGPRFLTRVERLPDVPEVTSVPKVT